MTGSCPRTAVPIDPSFPSQGFSLARCPSCREALISAMVFSKLRRTCSCSTLSNIGSLKPESWWVGRKNISEKPVPIREGAADDGYEESNATSFSRSVKAVDCGMC